MAALDAFFPNADLSFGLLGTELWSGDGAALGAKALRRLGRGGFAEFAGNLLSSSRDWLRDDLRLAAGPRAARALGAAHGARPGCRFERAS